MDPAEKKAMKLRIEKQLVPRLKLMGVILLFFGLCSLIFALFVHPLPFATGSTTTLSDTSQEQLLDLGAVALEEETFDPLPLAHETLNFFFVTIVFCGVGLTCIFISWKKRHLYQNMPQPPQKN